MTTDNKFVTFARSAHSGMERLGIDNDAVIHLLDHWSERTPSKVNQTDAFMYANDDISAIVIHEEVGGGRTRLTVVSVRKL